MKSRENLFQSLLFNKVAGLRPAALLKKRLWRRFADDFRRKLEFINLLKFA